MNRVNFFGALIFALYVISFPQIIHAAVEPDGKTLFKDNCKSCHTIGNGKMVGPDLKDIDKKRSEAWLFKWIKSSKSLIEANDPEAVALFEEYNKVPMLEFPALSDSNIRTIMDYIKSASNPIVTEASDPVPQQVNQAKSGQAPGWFSLPFNLLLGLITILLFVIYSLSRLVKQLVRQLNNAYIDNRSFF